MKQLLAEENNAISKEGARNGKWVKISMRKWTNPLSKKRILGVDQLTEDPSSSGQKDLVFVKSSANDTKVSIHGVERPWLSETEGFILPNHDTGRILPAESKRNTTDPLVAVIDSSVIEYDSANESSVYSTLLSPLKKLDGAEPISGSKTIKSHLRSKSTFKAETLKGVKINEPSSAPAKGNKSSSASKVNSAPAGKLKSVKIEDDPPLAIIIKELIDLRLQISKNQSSYSRNNQQGEALQAKKAEALKSTRAESSNANRSKTPTRSQLCDAKYIVQFDEKRGTIFNSNKEIVMIAPGVRDVKWNSIISNFCDEKGISQNFSSPYTPKQNGIAERKKTLIEAARTMLLGSVFSKQYWTKAVTTACYTQNRCPVCIHNHKYYLGKFDEKADDGYFLGYSLVSKAFRVFNTRRQQTEENYHITFDESTDAIKFIKPSDDNITIAESERYTHDEYLLLYEPSRRYQVKTNVVSFIDPYERLEPVVIKTYVSYDQHDQANQNDQNDHLAHDDEILNDDQSEHSNHNNDNHIIDNLPNTKDVQSYEPLSSPAEDASDKHIELVNIIGDPGARMLTRAMAKELSAASAHECLFVDFLSKEEPKKVSEAFKHPGWVDAIQEELNQFARNKIRLVAQGYNQQEGIDYDKTFSPVARLVAIRIFLAFATYMNFTVYQMDVKSAFLNGKLKEEVYVKQPLGFESNEFPNHVFKLDKAIYRLKQASRAWYPKGTPNLGLWYLKCSGFDLKGYSDSDYAGCNMDKKITSDHILKGDIELHFIPTQYQLANIFTKPLDEPTFKRLICELGMLNIDGSKPEPSNISSEED
ncbi:retrovirus-related pol polyprotein from transposon TNT 1-94 [Tanacetum coccineum]|uniref:Retrovirus-related pol polyprotein from transposon TNT 1-94 n=1 Tax=Tanacetum coccineum TaxID=301880 RepID=A0ABQ5DGL4_9ASTR